MACRVVIADDEQDSIQHLTELLKPLGLQLIVTSSGEEALAKVRASIPDLILTDVVMPGIGGFGLIKAIKADEKLQKVPILVFTARAKMKDTLMALGIEGVISKPYVDGDLVDMVRALLKLAPAAQPAVPAAPSDAAPSPLAETKKEPEEKPAPAKPAAAPEAKPQAAGSTPPAGSQPAALASAAAAPLAGLRYRAILLGGALEILTKIQSLLAQVKCQATIVENAKEAVERVVEYDPDLVILDVITEGAAARDIIKRMRKNPFLKTKKVLVFSHIDKEKFSGSDAHQVSLDIEASKTFCMEAGADDYLGTFDEQRFLEAVGKHLKK